MMDMEAVIRRLQDTMVVMAEVEQRTAAGLKEQTEWLAGQPRRRRQHEEWLANDRRAMAEFDRKMEALREFIRRQQQ